MALQKISDEIRSFTKKNFPRCQKNPDSPGDWQGSWPSPGQIRLADSSKATRPSLSSASRNGCHSTFPSKRLKQSSTSKSLQTSREKRDLPPPSSIGEPAEKIRCRVVGSAEESSGTSIGEPAEKIRYPFRYACQKRNRVCQTSPLRTGPWDRGNRLPQDSQHGAFETLGRSGLDHTTSGFGTAHLAEKEAASSPASPGSLRILDLG